MIEQERTIIRLNNGNNIATSQQRNTVKILAIFEMILCILVVFGGIAEVVLSTYCVDYSDYWHYYYYNCFYDQTFGQALWCSLFPFIASIIGIVTAKSPTMEKVRLLMGFSIVGVLFLITLICLELYHLGFYRWQSPTWNHRSRVPQWDYDLYVGYFALQWAILGCGVINLILMFTSACCSCCMGNQNNEVGQGNFVTNYGGQQPVYSISSGMQGNPQQRHQVMMTSQQQQQQQYINPLFYTQPQRESTQFIIVQQEPTQQPQIIQREMTLPHVVQREMTQPQIIQREMTQPQIIQREMTQPQIIQREMTQPQIIQREMTQPQIIQREMTQPQIERSGEEIESEINGDEKFSTNEEELKLPQQIE